MSTALSIAHSVSARGAEPKIGQRMKKDIVKAMKKAKEMCRTGHTLAGLTDGSIDYTEEASDRYQEGMDKSNMFAECAVAKILLHFRAALRRSGNWISASQLVEYKATPIDVEAGPPGWEKVAGPPPHIPAVLSSARGPQIVNPHGIAMARHRDLMVRGWGLTPRTTLW